MCREGDNSCYPQVISRLRAGQVQLTLGLREGNLKVRRK